MQFGRRSTFESIGGSDGCCGATWQGILLVGVQVQVQVQDEAEVLPDSHLNSTVLDT
jgi:hypothetical protein